MVVVVVMSVVNRSGSYCVRMLLGVEGCMVMLVFFWVLVFW